jgi:transposase-like protein
VRERPHRRLARKLRKRPAHIAQYDAAFKATAVEAVRRYGLDSVWQALGVKRETVAAWVRHARKGMNGCALAAEEREHE